MSYRPYAPPAPLLIGYDPFRDLPPDHLARLGAFWAGGRIAFDDRAWAEL